MRDLTLGLDKMRNLEIKNGAVLSQILFSENNQKQIWGF